jgi:signal recognition particle subunit SRP54
MFESLSKSLNGVFRNLRGRGKLSEKNVKDALREVRMALLEADVNYQVAKSFVADVKEKCLGEEVLQSVTPGQQFVKFVHAELVELLGGAHREFDLSGKPASILMLGLHGAGKTTTCGKLALRFKKQGHNVVMVACDIRRPAAVDQLRILSDQAGVGFVAPREGESVPEMGARAREHAEKSGYTVALYDTGGRFQIDEELVGELVSLRDRVEPGNVVLVLDAAIGQESVEVASRFNEAVGLTGLILTKLDGDARGGAALSVHAVTRSPILMTGSGERQEDLEPFYPDRMASRILGMGDVVSLVEKAQESIDLEEMGLMEERLSKNTLNFEDFLKQIHQMKKLGPLENLLDMLPGVGQLPEDVRSSVMGQSADGMKRAEAIILSMTPQERKRPELLNASRRRRIATGSGTHVRDVNQILKSFQQTKKMSTNMKKMQKKLLRMGR